VFKIPCIADTHNTEHGQATASIYEVVTYLEKLAPRISKYFYTIDKFLYKFC